MLLTILMGVMAVVFLLAILFVDTLPEDLTIVLVSAMFIMLVLSCILFSRKKRVLRIMGIIVAAAFFIVFGSTSYFMGTTYAMLNQISANKVGGDGTGANINPVEEPFNVYITGIDQWEDEKGLDLERSDVNMLVTVNPVTKKILLTSIPRDSYVKLHSSQQMDKLTHSGIYGVDETLNTVKDWFGIDISYYFKMNFSAAVEIIDALGGIKVYSPVAFESSLKGYKYKKGWNYLGGYKALYFARERHAFEGEDAMRVENQQRVMTAIIKKMTTSTALLTNYGDVMNAASNNLQTDMTSDEMLELVKMQLTDLSEWDIQTQKIEGEYDEDYVASLTQARKFSIYRPDPKSEEKCIDNINSIMKPTEAELEKAREIRNKGFVTSLISTMKEKAPWNKDEDPEEK